MSSRWSEVVVDSIDPARLARWWAEVLGYQLISEVADEVSIGSGEGVHPQLVFVRIAQPKSGKNRLHLDLRPDNQEAEVERLVDMGARRVDIGQGDQAPWVVLADPEGNEFCVLEARNPLAD